MGSREAMNAVAKRKIPFPCRESNPGRPTRSIVSILTQLPPPTALKKVAKGQACHQTLLFNKRES
jgi:hypothetical protein